VSIDEAEVRHDDAVAFIVRRGKGAHVDPTVVDAFLEETRATSGACSKANLARGTRYEGGAIVTK
jgi:response regulator RpfG family c-di-GMP phosphodiesterase